MSYKHLSLEERHYIELSMKNEKTLIEIADDLRRSQSTISREIKRNLGCKGYRHNHNQADGMAKERHVVKYKATKMTAKIIEIIDNYIYQDWSPEQAVSAWLRQGERCADEIACQPFEKKRFREVLTGLRALTNETESEVFVTALVEACSQAGVAVVFAPTPKGCPISGATRWLSADKALLMLSLRHATNDHLWFAFFHEAGHLLLHGKKMIFLETKGLDDEHEQQADKFARDLLIPSAHASQLPFLEKTYAAVKQFAEEVGVAPAIVVGRMQKEGYLTWNLLNKCKVRYKWNHT